MPMEASCHPGAPFAWLDWLVGDHGLGHFWLVVVLNIRSIDTNLLNCTGINVECTSRQEYVEVEASCFESSSKARTLRSEVVFLIDIIHYSGKV